MRSEAEQTRPEQSRTCTPVASSGEGWKSCGGRKTIRVMQATDAFKKHSRDTIELLWQWMAMVRIELIFFALPATDHTVRHYHYWLYPIQHYYYIVHADIPIPAKRTLSTFHSPIQHYTRSITILDNGNTGKFYIKERPLHKTFFRFFKLSYWDNLSLIRENPYIT